ncbi:cytochrome c oxidase subunit I [Sphingomonas daechungensis]|uniref:Cytochrome c oxidase subunit 1 n=1 Tax=Sphingomonas daechungensis TaxID=1176646 RepID=A0ABX6T258_9SPHN|nr:cytochrome c oxidase subunit I [Sphingomonas daechungensis]QNP43909.1 cytochrome c oxidase subunit I [Sphingomonas daechungensis]
MKSAAERAKLPPADVPRDGPNLTGEELETKLSTTWSNPPGFVGWLSSVDHKDIGRRYVITALVFLALAGVLAIAMRLQLARPDNDLIGAARYNEIFTMHGTTMMFLFAVPVMQGMQIYLTPLMIGTRSNAFPRLNAFSYWMYLAGGLLLWIAFVLNVGPDVGWFAYPPLSGPQFGVGKRVDIWAQMITFTEVAALAAAVSLTATILKQKAPGMSLARMPIFVWATLVTSLMVIFSMPSVALASGMLLSDRLVGTHFYNPAERGDALLWQHLFWFFGHPEVYIIFLPATGFVSEIVATFSRRSIVMYPIVVMSLVATGILAFGLWVHHMFATGLPRIGYSFYTAASMSVSIPTGLQIFCWIATLWEGRPQLKVPLLYVIGFIFTFVIGGLTGVMIAAVPLDLQLHDTYFIVAHFHYVLIGGAVFPLLGAITYWFPKATGRLMSETLGKIAFWMIFLGFQLAFFPMHIAGIYGMPRRVYTYPAGMGLELPNMLSTLGSLVVSTAVLLFVVNLVISARSGRRAAPNPWGAPSLEWATSCPPPPYNFPHIPLVSSRTPLWDAGEKLPVVHGLRVEDRELVLTTVMSAEPDVREPSPEPSPWPLIGTVATTAMFVCSIFSPWAVLVGVVPVALALTAWFWPKSPRLSGSL